MLVAMTAIRIAKPPCPPPGDSAVDGAWLGVAGGSKLEAGAGFATMVAWLNHAAHACQHPAVAVGAARSSVDELGHFAVDRAMVMVAHRVLGQVRTG